MPMIDLRARFTAAVAAIAFSTAVFPAGAADQTVTSCANANELMADLAAMQSSGGGTLTFTCATATIVLTSDLPNITTATTIDGGGKITISGGNSRRIFVVGGGGTLTLQNIVLSNGSTTGDGGAIFSQGSLVLKKMTIRDSYAGLSGGAFVAYGPTQIEDSVLAFNKATNGGAVYARFPAAPVTIEDSELYDNEADTTNENEGFGGAVFLWDGASVTIRNSELRDNYSNAGGAIYNGFSNSTVTIERTRIVLNSTNRGFGGGIFVGGGPLTIVDSYVVDNATPGYGGGLYYRDGSSATILRSTFSLNYGQNGGGIAVGNSTGVSLVNVTISSNDAFNGGGMTVSESAVSLDHVTIASNTTGEGTGGLAVLSTGGRTSTMRNSLLAGNEFINCAIPVGHLVSSDGNVSSDSSCFFALTQGHDRHDADTLLGPLGDHGGRTPTHVPGPGSEAIDAGILAGAPPIDQRGVTRPQGASVDAGAVEVATCSPGPAICGDANENQSLQSTDALLALRSAVGSATCPLWLCDYNGSGSLTSSDAFAILRAAVGQPGPAQCPPKWDCHDLG